MSLTFRGEDEVNAIALESGNLELPWFRDR